MILYSGLESVIGQVQKNFRSNPSFIFKAIADPYPPSDLRSADLFVIGPGYDNPVRGVQKVVAKEKHLSIIILADKDRYNQIKQSLQFSPLVGNNATCLIYNPDLDYTTVFQAAQARTIQKRSFAKFQLAAATAVPSLSSSAVKLEKFSRALEYAPIGVLLLNESEKIIGANKRSRGMFSQLETGQIDLAKLFPEKCVREIREHINAGKEEPIYTEDLAGSYYEISASTFSEDSGVQHLLLINDVTERKEKDLRVATILESLPQMAWTATPEGKVTYYTNGWFSYTNQREQEALQDGWTSVVHPADLRATTARWIESIRTHKVYQHAVRFRRYDGEYRWHLSRAVPVLNGKKQVMMWVGTSTDIHDQVLLADNLEKKVRERTRSLEEANEELEQFAYITSHDLQEPLRKIHTFAGLFKDINYPSLDNGSKKYLDKIIDTATRMSRLLKDLLSFTKLHHNEGRTSVDLTELMNAIREDLELTVSQTNAEIRVEPLPSIEGHISQLRQLFYNLISNALKFHSPHRRPEVVISAKILAMEDIKEEWGLQEEKEYYQITVKDNGIGFDQKYAEQIFTIFQRLHGRNAFEGTGIGLAIARKVVSNHGGVIFAESTPGEGTKFHVVLPA